MSSITLTKIELSGYRFLSNGEFMELENYLPGITYFVYDATKDFTDVEDDRPSLTKYFMRADRCVKVDMNGNLNEIYTITNPSGSVIANYGTDVKFIYGTGNNDKLTIKLPVGDTYAGKLPVRPNTSNLIFVGWTRNGETVTDKTIIKYGDELRADFEVAGSCTHPFGPLFAETGKWVVNNSDFTATYTAEYRHTASKLHMWVKAKYIFDSDTLMRDDPIVILDLDETFYINYSSQYVSSVDYGAYNKWFSPYGAALVEDISTREMSIEFGHTQSTILVFDHNQQEYTYYDTDLEDWWTEEAIDYTGVTNTIYLGKGVGSIYAVKTDGTLRTVRSDVGSTSAVSNTTVTWASTDTGVLVLTGSWAYVAMGTTTSQTESNYDARPLTMVANYACSTLAANGFTNHLLNAFYASSNLTLVNGGLSAEILVTVIAGTLTTVASGLNGFSCTDLYVDRFASSIVANWANGAVNYSTATGLTTLIIQTVPAGSNTVNLATGNSKFNAVAILDCHVISGTNTSATTTTFAAANVSDGIFIKYADDISVGTYGFNGLTNPIRLYNDGIAGASELRDALPATVYKASSGAVFYGNDLFGITYNGTSIKTSPINKIDEIMCSRINIMKSTVEYASTITGMEVWQ